MKKMILASVALVTMMAGSAFADTDITAENKQPVKLDANLNNVKLNGGKANSAAAIGTGASASASFTYLGNPSLLAGAGSEVAAALGSMNIKASNNGKVNVVAVAKDAVLKGGINNSLGLGATGAGAGVSINITQK